MPLTVILDMDGLMLDTEPISRRVWSEAGLEHGYQFGAEVFAQMVGRNNVACRAVVQEHFGQACPVDVIANRASQLYRDLMNGEEVPHKTGLVPFLQFLDARHIARAVATSTAAALARHKLSRAGVSSFLDIVVGGDQVEHGKPAPDIFLAAAERLHARPEDCVVLEDSEAGIRAAAAAGMRSILIPDGSEPTAVARATCSIMAGSLLEAADIIASWIDKPAVMPAIS